MDVGFHDWSLWSIPWRNGHNPVFAVAGICRGRVSCFVMYLTSNWTGTGNSVCTVLYVVQASWFLTGPCHRNSMPGISFFGLPWHRPIWDHLARFKCKSPDYPVQLPVRCQEVHHKPARLLCRASNLFIVDFACACLRVYVCTYFANSLIGHLMVV